LRFKILQLSSP